MHGAQLLYNSDSYIAFERKKRYTVYYIIMCFSDKKLLLFTTVVTATIFVYKWTERFRYCSTVLW